MLDYVARLGAKCKSLLLSLCYFQQSLTQIAEAHGYRSARSTEVQKFKKLFELVVEWCRDASLRLVVERNRCYGADGLLALLKQLLGAWSGGARWYAPPSAPKPSNTKPCAPPAGGVQGPSADLEITAREVVKIRDEHYGIYAGRTGKTHQQIHADSDRDHWLHAGEVRTYGLIDEVRTREPSPAAPKTAALRLERNAHGFASPCPTTTTTTTPPPATRTPATSTLRRRPAGASVPLSPLALPST